MVPPAYQISSFTLIAGLRCLASFCTKKYTGEYCRVGIGLGYVSLPLSNKGNNNGLVTFRSGEIRYKRSVSKWVRPITLTVYCCSISRSTEVGAQNTP